MIPFASEVILFVCHPPISEITQGATLADELYPHFYLKKIFPGSNPYSAEMAEPGFEPGTF